MCASSYVSHHDQLMKQVEGLMGTTGTKPPTYKDIWKAILVIDEGGAGCIPQSVGMDRIVRNPGRFKDLVSNFTFFVIQAWREVVNPSQGNHEHLRFWFFPHLLVREELVRLFGDEERERFVTEIYVEFGAINDLWIDVALKLGVSEEAIAKAIVARLHSIEHRPGIADCMNEFLRHGAELVRTNSIGDASDTQRYALSKNCVWARMPKDKLKAALQICASKHPGGVLARKPWLAMRIALGEQIASEIVHSAACRLTSLAGVSQEVIATLTKHAKEQLARRIDLNVFMHDDLRWATVQFLVSLRDPSNRYNLYDLFFALIDHERTEIGPDLIYRIVRKMYGLDSKAERTARDFLLERGWGCGIVEEEVFDHPKKGETSQLIVWYDGGKFVQGRHDSYASHRYHPAPGDHVIFRIEDARWLVPNHVCLVRFVDVTDRT